jgi:hypothetical protein
MNALTAWVQGVSLIGPGLAGWEASRAVLCGQAVAETAATAVPPLAVLPPAERRRVGAVVKLALAAGLQAAEAAGAEPAGLPTVFASAGGDGANCHAICETLASDDRLISPTRFHNSVHNAASGYWGIATGAMAPSAIISAWDGSFAAGLLEAVVQLATPGETAGSILLVAHDCPYPEPLHAARPMVDAFGTGLVLAAGRGDDSLARISLEPCADAVTTLADAHLEAVRRGIPAARSLPLLAALAAPEVVARRVVLEYLDGLQLAVTVTPA